MVAEVVGQDDDDIRLRRDFLSSEALQREGKGGEKRVAN